MKRTILCVFALTLAFFLTQNVFAGARGEEPEMTESQFEGVMSMEYAA